MDATAPNPDAPCPHLNFDADVQVARIVQDEQPGAAPHAFMCEVTVHCTDCKEPFRFNGLTAGMSFTHPMVSVDEKTLRAPIRPASADPDFGFGIPGFAIKAVFP